MYRIAIFVSAVFAGYALAAPVPKDPEPPILAVVKRDNCSQLVLFDAEGKNPKALTDDRSNASWPAWSRDGKRIVFCSDRAGEAQVFIMDADGLGVKQLTNMKGPCKCPVLSPDGKTLAFAYARGGGNWEVSTMDIESGEFRSVCGGWDPTWSADGKSILFPVDGLKGCNRLFAWHPAKGTGSYYSDIDPEVTGMGHPDWSHDKTLIAVSQKVGTSNHILTVSLKPDSWLQNKPLTTGKGNHRYPGFSADDKRILFHQTDEDGTGSIAVMDADGKNAKVLVKDVPFVEGGRPRWKPR